MSAYYKTSYRVRISDSDRFARLKMPALLQMLQEIATEHAKIIGVDYEKLKPLNLGWALSKIVVDIDRIPRWGERVNLRTWPSDRGKITVEREFEGIDENDEPLFTARSQWILFDVIQRRIARLNRISDFPSDLLHANAEDFSTPLLRPENPVYESVFEARDDDIDLNGHVNNSVFLIWGVECVPSEFRALREPKRVAVNFMEEVMPRSEIRAKCEIEKERTVATLMNADGSREYARVAIDWRARQNS